MLYLYCLTNKLHSNLLRFIIFIMFFLLTSNTKKSCLFIIIIVSIWSQTNVYVSRIFQPILYGDKDSITTSIIFYSYTYFTTRKFDSKLGKFFLSIRTLCHVTFGEELHPTLGNFELILLHF